MRDLPVPDADALAHCERVAAAIRAEIVRASGWISFARYMELALYAPNLGYYAAGATKLGAAGDYTTAPEMSPLYGAALARQVAAILEGSARKHVLELGGGTGRLAATLMRTLAAQDAMPEQYAILERSPDLRARQRELIATEVPEHADRFVWLDTLPERIDGAVIANEVLDAIAVHVVRRREGAIFERGVSCRTDAAAPNFGLEWADRVAVDSLSRLAAARLPDEDDYTSEINPAAEALVRDIATRLASGAVLFIDYGFPAREYYHPQRSTGTLVCHYRHRVHDDPFLYPGLCDITAHVDFSAMAAAGLHCGLQLAGFCAQAPFLISCGILEALQAVGAPDSLAYMKAASQVQTLLSPAEMGELFKVLALSRSPSIAWPGFALADQRHRL